MKRVKAECLEQTLHFFPKDGLAPDEAKVYIRQEYGHYKAQLEQRGTQYKILEEVEQPDGTLMVKLKRQNNYHPVGSYLD